MVSTRVCLLLILCLYGAYCQKYETPIKHFVVVMLENRAFDHMLGHLKSYNPEINGLTGRESNPIDPTKESSKHVRVTFDAPDSTEDPGHSISATEIQIYGHKNGSLTRNPKMNGFIASAKTDVSEEWSEEIMKCLKHENAPVISTLAKEFALFDMWFSSVPGPTQPNRMFMHSCTSDGMGKNDEWRLFLGLPQRTIYQSVEESGHKWRIYFEQASETLLLAQMRKPEYFNNYKWFSSFGKDVAVGDLPTLTMIHPSYFSTSSMPASDQHPDHAITEGERFLKYIYETLRQSPIWNQTAIIVTYDEHGGFYDHHPPPIKNVPSPDNKRTPEGFDFTRLGIRIPTIVISPWVNKQVVHEPVRGGFYFDHTSIHATMKRMFGLKSFLTKRDQYAGSFENLFEQRSSPRTDCPLKLPEVPDEVKVFKEIPEHNQKLNSLQKSLILITEGALKISKSQVDTIETEEEGSDYVKSLMTRFLNGDF